MRAVRGLLIPGALLFLTVTLPPDSAAQAPVEVNTCGQVVTGDGFLAADLDCNGFTGGLLDYGAAVVLSRGSTLDLGGFTLRGGQIGVICAKPCGGGTNTLCGVPICKIRGGGGTIAGATVDGILGQRVILDDVTVRDHGQAGISTYNGVPRLTNSFVTGNMIGIDTNRYVVLIDSTVTGNSAENIRSTHGVRLHGSSTVGP